MTNLSRVGRTLTIPKWLSDRNGPISPLRQEGAAAGVRPPANLASRLGQVEDDSISPKGVSRVQFQYSFVPVSLAAASLYVPKPWIYEQAVDLASVAANTTADQTVAITSAGIVLKGDPVQFLAAASLEHGLVVQGAKKSPSDNNVALRVSNVTGGAIDSASQTFSFLLPGTRSGVVPSRRGSILALAYSLSAAKTAGAGTLTCYQNGTALSAALTVGNNTSGRADFAPGAYPFVGGDTLDVRLTTDGSFAPADSLTLEATMYIAQWTTVAP